MTGSDRVGEPAEGRTGASHGPAAGGWGYVVGVASKVPVAILVSVPLLLLLLLTTAGISRGVVEVIPAGEALLVLWGR